MPGPDGGEARWLRFRVRPLQEAGQYARWTAWTVGEVTRERARQEDFFVELRDAIDFLDHAPVGFFSVDPKGKVREGDVDHVDVMRREKGFGEAYGKNRTAEWEFAGYRPDGSYTTSPAKS